MWSINFNKEVMEERVASTIRNVAAMAGKAVPRDFLDFSIGPNPRFTGKSKIVIRPPEYIEMGGHYLPERKEVFAKVRYDGVHPMMGDVWSTTARDGKGGWVQGKIKSKRPGAAWIRVA